jgi:hypothetical protein
MPRVAQATIHGRVGLSARGCRLRGWRHRRAGPASLLARASRGRARRTCVADRRHDGPDGAELLTGGQVGSARGSHLPGVATDVTPGCADHTTPGGRGYLTADFRSARSCASPGTAVGSDPAPTRRRVPAPAGDFMLPEARASPATSRRARRGERGVSARHARSGGRLMRSPLEGDKLTLG